MNNGQYWIYEGVIAEQSMWGMQGWTLELLEEYATRVKIKQPKPKPTHHVISNNDLIRICEWFKHSSNNVSVDLSVEDFRLNVELLKMLDGV